MNHKLQHQNLTLQFTLIQCCHWGSCAAILGFCSVYLLDYGFTNTQIGIIAAGAYIVSSLVSGVLAFYADSSARVSLKKIISVLNVIHAFNRFSFCCLHSWHHGFKSSFEFIGNGMHESGENLGFWRHTRYWLCYIRTGQLCARQFHLKKRQLYSACYDGGYFHRIYCICTYIPI